jgi:hypothetical protein
MRRTSPHCRVVGRETCWPRTTGAFGMSGANSPGSPAPASVPIPVLLTGCSGYGRLAPGVLSRVQGD